MLRTTAHAPGERRSAASPPRFATPARPFVVQARTARGGDPEREGERTAGLDYRLDRLRVHRLPAAGRVAGEPLPERVRRPMEAYFGADLASVRVHRGGQAEAVAAEAFTRGEELHFAPGRYQPDGLAGRRLIGHELAHVMQQRAGRVAAPQGRGAPVNADPALEAEAEGVGNRAAAFTRAAWATPTGTPGIAAGELPAVPAVSAVSAPASPAAMAPAAAAAPAVAAAPAARAAATPAAARPIQCVGSLSGQSKLDSELRQKFNKTINQLNQSHKKGGAKTEKNIHQQMGMVDSLEHDVYRWFGENQDSASHPQRRAMFDLLDEVQGHHKTLIKKTVETGSKLWVKDDVDKEGRKDVDDLWGALVKGDENFKMPTQVDSAGKAIDIPDKLQQKFKADTLASMARLMSRPKGRSLVKALHEGRGGDKGIDFALPSISKLRGTDGYGTPYVGAKAQAYSDQDATLKLKGEKRKNRKVVAGTGSGSGVIVAPGIKDSSMLDFDRSGKTILSPAFVGLGHELIHSAHYQRGTYIGPKGQTPHTDVPKEYGGDLEEFLTISSPKEQRGRGKQKVSASLGKLSGEGSQQHRFKLSELTKLNAGLPTEAEIRDEHGLGIRHGHSSMANPTRFRGATKGEDPGEHVTDSIDWLGGFGKPKPPKPKPKPKTPVQNQVVPQQQPAPWYSQLGTGIQQNWKGLARTAVIGGGLLLLKKYGGSFG